MRWNSAASSRSMRLCGMGLVVAALLMSTSSRPHLSMQALMRRSQSSLFDTSPCTAISSAPAPVTTAAFPFSSNTRLRLRCQPILFARHLRRLGEDLLREGRNRADHGLDVFPAARLDLELALARLLEKV